MNQRKRRNALLLCIGMILSLSVSSAYIVHVSGHACDGKSCQTCVLVAETIALLSSFALLGAIIRTLFSAVFSLRITRVKVAGASGLPCTLVGWKVRLNN